mmetsp:Transcript_11896/g.34020  ORF Transcript_11896/g.34020 Transcript_11896/m.34020 type:complete len:270 (-) Transcript_11896:246-1055(-)
MGQNHPPTLQMHRSRQALPENLHEIVVLPILRNTFRKRQVARLADALSIISTLVGTHHHRRSEGIRPRLSMKKQVNRDRQHRPTLQILQLRSTIKQAAAIRVLVQNRSPPRRRQTPQGSSLAVGIGMIIPSSEPFSPRIATSTFATQPDALALNPKGNTTKTLREGRSKWPNRMATGSSAWKIPTRTTALASVQRRAFRLSGNASEATTGLPSLNKTGFAIQRLKIIRGLQLHRLRALASIRRTHPHQILLLVVEPTRYKVASPTDLRT